MTDDLWAGTEIIEKPRMKSWVPDKMPEDLEAEASFISTCCAPGVGLAGPEAASTLIADDFAHPYHRLMFMALRELQKKDSEVNALTLKAEMERQGTLVKVGGFVTLTETLMKDDVERPMILAEIIKEKSRLRTLIKTGGKIIEKALGHGDYLEIVSEASEAVTKLAMADPGKQIITDLTDLIDDLSEGRQITTANGGHAMSWGDDTLDRLCPIPRGEPTIVCARPGVGKSCIAIQILVATIEKGYGKPLFLSLEMGREKIKARLAAHLAGVNSRVFRDAQYDKEAIDRVWERKRVLSGMKVMFPNQQCRVEEIESLTKHAVEIYGVDSIIIDQFSHIAAPREAKNEIYAIANARTSAHITAMVKNLNLGCVMLAQINKDGDDNRRPTKKDLAASDRIIQDAAVAFGLWNKGVDGTPEVWGTIMKNRDEGMEGWAKKLEVDYGTCRFKVEEGETVFTPKARFRG